MSGEEGAGRRLCSIHGGGWTGGEPTQSFDAARHFAERGLVAVVAQYRLSDQNSITPIEAIADAQTCIGWARSQAKRLGVDPERVAAYGTPAGGHLAASAAIFDGPVGAGGASASPNAVIVVSPAVALAFDGYFQRLQGKRARAVDYSPAEHTREGLPAALVLQGDADTVTPLAGAKRFCERMRALKNTCEMGVIEGFGQVYTPAGVRDDGWPKPDPAMRAEGLATADRFLQALGYVR